MKKIVALVLALCFVFLFATEAFAAKPTITKQPETATTNKKNSVSFSVEAKGTVSSYSWFFVNPETGKKISGKKLSKQVKGVKVTGPNRPKITLTHVPESMHGWLVYCVVGGSGYKVDSEYATLLINGMDPPETAPAGGLEITTQPKNTAVNKDGKVSFSFKYTGLAEKITWAFINPKNDEKVIGKKITNRFKDLKVSGINKNKLTLSNVPEKMIGWKVYAHIKGKGIEINTDTVLILSADAAADAKAKDDTKTKAAAETKVETATPQPEAASGPEDNTVAETDDYNATEGLSDTVSNNTIVVSCSASVLRKLDSTGKVSDDEPASRLEFLNTGSFIVSSDKAIQSWTINGIRYEPEKPVTEFKVMNISEDLVLSLKYDRSSSSSSQVDRSNMCKVLCSGCSFTYLTDGLRSVTEGEVPAGAKIRIFADTSDLAANGYRINSGEIINQGLSSFQFTVTDHVTITCTP